MAPRLIYRWEHPEDGKGPWTSEHGLFITLEASKMPACSEDDIPVGKCGSDWICGFLSRQDMRQWFTLTDVEACQSKGFQFIRYAVPPGAIAIGREQVTFLRGAGIKGEPVEWAVDITPRV